MEPIKIFWTGFLVGMVVDWAASQCPYVLHITCIAGRWGVRIIKRGE